MIKLKIQINGKSIVYLIYLLNAPNGINNQVGINNPYLTPYSKKFQMDYKSKYIKQVYNTTRRKHLKNQSIHIHFLNADVRGAFLARNNIIYTRKLHKNQNFSMSMDFIIKIKDKQMTER